MKIAILLSLQLLLQPAAFHRRQPTGFADKISEADDYIFRAATTASDEAPLIIDFILNKLNSTSIGIIYLNNDFGISYRNRIEALLKEKEIDVLLSEAANPADSDFRTMLQKMSNRGVRTILIATSCCTIPINVVKQAKEMNLDFTYIGAGVIEDDQFLEGVEEAAEGLYVLSTIDFSEDQIRNNAELKRFVDAFSESYPGKLPNRDRVQTFIAVSLIAKAVKTCGADADCVRDWLYGVKDKQTVLGSITVNEFGDVKYSNFVFKQVRNGTFVRVEE